MVHPDQFDWSALCEALAAATVQREQLAFRSGFGAKELPPSPQGSYVRQPQPSGAPEHVATSDDFADASHPWPAAELALCGQYGVYRWFVPAAWSGWNWTSAEVAQGYLHLSQACLTTAFIITQRTGACRRILASNNQPLCQELLPDLVSGRSFATVAISHLTTSRRHMKVPVLRARPEGDDFLLDGFSPWVTGARWARHIVTGATLDDGRQVLLAVPTHLPGIQIPPPARLVALEASHTGEVRYNGVVVSRHYLLAGPVENVMQQGIGAKTGGLETSTLALGLSAAALEFLRGEARLRGDLETATAALQEEQAQLRQQLLALAEGQTACTTEELRAKANSLVLRATQAALAAAKGSGYVHGHPAGRWCREALFFLVWSCPPGVVLHNLCELANLSG